MMRRKEILRKTNETRIRVSMNLDGTGKSAIETGVGFLDHLLALFAFHAGIDLEIEAAGDDVCGELLAKDAVLHDVVVVELPRVRYLAFGTGELFLEQKEILVGLQVGITLRNGKEGLQSAGELILGQALVLDVSRAHRPCAGLGHLFQRLALVLGVSFDRLDEVGNEVVPPLELNIYLRPRVLDPVAQRYQPVESVDYV